MSIYFLFITIISVIIYILAILIIYSCYIIHKNKKEIKWPILILRYFLPFCSISFYGQIFLFLASIFICQDGHSYVSMKLKCRKGEQFIIHSLIAGFAMVFLIIIAFLTNALYYKALFIKSNSDVLKKTNSISDISLFFTKTIINISFIIDKQNESANWEIIIFLMIISGINVYFNYLFKNRLNSTLMILNIIFSIIVFLGFLTLFVGNILKFLGFNGSIYFYLIGFIDIFIFILFYRNKEIDFVLIDYKNIHNDNEYANYILRYYILILNKNNSRNYSTILKCYIETIEETCTNIDCPLKLYLEQLEKGINYEYYLYQFLDKLFKYGISKFKNNVMLKNDYAFFLMSKMNNKKQAIKVLNNIIEENISFHRNYDIYRCKKLINKWPSNTSSFYFSYKNSINEFKQLISKLSLLYYEFWTLLYENKFGKNEKFKKLYEIGSKIMKLNKKLDKIYNLIINTKTNNIEIFKLYSEYLENILKDEDRLQENLTNNSIFRESIENDEKDFFNFNLDYLKESDVSRYILLSGRKKDLGKILDCSISASTLFGYTKDEVIGRHINIFIPDIFHSRHNINLYNNSKASNLNLYEHIFNKKEYNPNLAEGYFFGVFKSKFIKYLKLKVSFFRTEDNIITFLVTAPKDIPYMSELIKNRIIEDSNIDARCCILTDPNFLINSFTANSIEQLGLSYRYLKSYNSIFPFIKQLYEDYLNAINELNPNSISNQNVNKENESLDESSKFSEIDLVNSNISPEVKKKIKEDLINKKYNKKRQITWRINIKNDKRNNIYIKNDEDNIDFPKCSRISYRGSKYNILGNKKIDENRIEVEFLLEIKKSIIVNSLTGYYFFFSRLYPNETKNCISYTESSKNKSEEIKKIVKYKVIIKAPQESTILFNQKKKLFSKSVINQNKKNKNDIVNNENNNSFVSKKEKIKDNLKKKTNYLENADSNFNEPKIKKILKLPPDIDNNKIGEDDVVIKDDFIPSCQNNFSFDLNSIAYNFQKERINPKIFHTNLNKLANEKIKNYQEYLNYLNKKEESDSNKSNSEEEEEEYTSSSEEESESPNKNKEVSLSIKKNNKNLQKSISLKNKQKTKLEIIIPIRESNTLKIIKEVKENIEIDDINDKNKSKKSNNENSSLNIQQMKKIQTKNYINNYYKVYLNNIHYMIYDFNKDMFVEGNKNEIISKVEYILNNSKKQNNIVIIGKDEKYPFISFKNNKEMKKSLNEKLENETKIDDNQKNINNEEKILARKINDAISNKKDEYELKLFKTNTIISFSIIFICLIIIFIINSSFYKQLKDILSVLQNIIYIKYCKTYSTYLIRELILLNFDFQNLEGGQYYAFPAFDRTNYENLIKDKLIYFFLENQNSLKQILTSEYSLSGNLEKNLSNTIFDSEYINNVGIGSIEGDALSILLQYNTILYDIASSFTPIYQNHSEVFNYFHNNYDKFGKALDFLWEKYYSELYITKFNIIIYFIISSIIILIIYILFCYFMVTSFISAAKRRISYMQVFYGISSNSIKNIMSNCEKLLFKLKKDKHKNTEEEDINEESEEEKSIVQQKFKKQKTSRDMNIINSRENNNSSVVISFTSKLFFIFYILFMIVMYTYFPFIIYYLYNISIKTKDFANFSLRLNNFHLGFLDLYNIYREYLFDNYSTIYGIYSYDYITKMEAEVYQNSSENIKMISNFIFANIQIDEGLFNFFNRELCSFFITDFFNSSEQCHQKFGKVFNYDFSIVITNFLQKINNLKNIVKYKYQTELIYGNLTLYEVDKWQKWNDNYFGEEGEQSNKKKSFKLDLFNNDILHSDINLMFINIFFPYTNENKIEVIKKANIDGKEKYFAKIFLLYLILLLLMYIAYLLPMINHINNFIYKTKNMLLLIPMTILSSQSNIKSLLNLS